MPEPLNYSGASNPITTATLRRRRSYAKRLLELAIVTLALLIILAMVSFGLLVLVQVFFYAIVLGVLLVGSGLYLYRAAYGIRSTRILLYVEGAIRMGVPLVPYLRSVADSESRKVRRRLLEMISLLEQGVPLALVLANTIPELDLRALSLIQLGDTTHRLPEMLTRIQQHQQSEARTAAGMRMLRWYVPVVLFSLVGVGSLIMIFVIPRFEMIFKDFRTPLPGVTISLLKVARFIAQDMGWILLLAILIPCVAAVGVETLKIVRPRSSYLHRRYRDLVLDHLPLLGRARYDHALAALCWTLAAGTREGQALTAITQSTLELPLHARIDQRLRSWHTQMQSGISPADSAVTAGLPSVIANLFRTPGDRLSDALQVLGDYYDNRSHRLLTLLHSAAIPITTLCFAAFVLWVALALLVPLQALSQHVMSQIWSIR